MQPMNNKVLNAASFKEYLHDRIKIRSKTVALAAKIATIMRDRTKVVTVVSPAELGFSNNRQLKYLSMRYYSRKQQVRDYLSVVDGSKKS
jgi:Ribosomal L22e protein family